MIAYLRSHLSAKLVLSYLAVVLVGVLVLAAVIQFTLPGAFDRHMLGMQQMLRQDMQHDLMPVQGRGQGMMLELYLGFRAAFADALTLALFAAIGATIVASLFFTRRVVSPLRAMMQASQRIAEGHYDERVQVSGHDELAQLGERFNSMAAQLEQVESRRRQLIGDVSHELRTPLTAIKGSMEGLIDGILPTTPETFEQIHREAGRLSRLVDDLQELSRVEAKAYQLDVCPVSVYTLVESTARRLERQFEEKGITLTRDLPANLPPVLADEDRISQVLTNLVYNAWQYTPSGSVTISAQAHNAEVWISVSDTGVGIPPEHLAHIFDRFYRVDKSRSRGSGGGSGIGLTVAKYLVEAHGGRIWAESEGEGKGSSFIFTLPAAKMEPQKS